MKKLLIIIAFLLSGCVSTSAGHQIDLSRLPEFKKGITTEDEVIQAFGNPIMRSSKSDGSKVLIYYFSQSQAHGIIGLGGSVKMDSTTTSIMFDQAGKYLSYETTQSQYGQGLPESSQASPAALTQ